MPDIGDLPDQASEKIYQPSHKLNKQTSQDSPSGYPYASESLSPTTGDTQQQVYVPESAVRAQAVNKNNAPNLIPVDEGLELGQQNKAARTRQ